MLNFLEKLPNIYIVFASFVFLLITFLMLRDNNIFTLMNTALGAVIGLAMKTNKPTQSITAETVNTDEISSGKSDSQ